MVWIRHHSFQTGLLTALLVSLGAFVVFHAIGALQFNIWFRRATLEDWQWVRMFLASWGRWATLYGVSIFLLVCALANQKARAPYAVTSLLTLFCAEWFHYPIITSVLFRMGQFPSYPDYLFESIPSIAKVLAASG